VPLHDQLCAQIGQLVAAGALAPGARLPSIRGLAARLGVHHQTVLAAYKTLAARGVVVIQSGSGVRVVDHAASVGGWREGVALRAMAAHFVAQARSRGHDAEAVLAACREAIAPSPWSRLVVVNPHPDLQAIYRHELAEHVALPIIGATLEETAEAGVSDTACYLTSTNHAAALKAVLGEGSSPVLFKLASTEALLAQVRALPSEAVVAVVSGSPRFLFLFQELLAGVRGEGQLLGAALDEPERLRAVLKLSSLVVTDSLGHGAIAGQTRAVVVRHRLLADEVYGELAARLPPEAFRPPGTAMGAPAVSGAP
jgi:DNA-binding transcriptional regulator YhcF (GntR family)